MKTVTVLSQELIRKLTERMGEAVHNKWMEKRRIEKGWHAPEECPDKKANPAFVGCKDGKYCQNCHPCMLPYSELPEKEKELDRQYPEIFLRLLDEEGFLIVEIEHYEELRRLTDRQEPLEASLTLNISDINVLAKLAREINRKRKHSN